MVELNATRKRRHSWIKDMPSLCLMKKSLSALLMLRGESNVIVGVVTDDGVEMGGLGVGPV
jgi:hypothetical protein